MSIMFDKTMNPDRVLRWALVLLENIAHGRVAEATPEHRTQAAEAMGRLALMARREDDANVAAMGAQETATELRAENEHLRSLLSETRVALYKIDESGDVGTAVREPLEKLNAWVASEDL